jgi:excisionase family DNA binding protein
MLKVKDIQEALGCSGKKAYAIVNQKDFPKIKIGKTFYIPEDEFDKWVKRYLCKEFEI